MTTAHPKRPRRKGAQKILAVDVGGTQVKVMLSPHSKRREFKSGPKLTPTEMVANVKTLTRDWACDAISIAYPGPAIHNRPLAEPHNLAVGHLRAALEPDYVVLGGGNAKILKDLPPDTRLGDNDKAFAGGFKFWRPKARNG